MKALVLSDNARQLNLTDIEPPQITAPDDVVIDVIQTGICGTDRSVLVGKFTAAPGTIMGHEAVGTVAVIGTAVTTVTVGDRVVINPTLFCSDCPQCRKGQFNHCLNKHGNEVGIDRHGSFAQQLVLPAQFVTPIPDTVPLDRATLFEPLCCALSNVAAADPRPGDIALILGGGPIGALAAIAAAHGGAETTIIETDPTRRQLLDDAFDHPDMPAIAIADTTALTGGPQADIVVDAVGTLLELGVTALKPNGTVVVMGYNDSATATLRPLDVLFGGLRIVGAGDYNFPRFQQAVDIGARLPLEQLITHKLDLADHEHAFSLLSAQPGAGYQALKVVLTSNSASCTTSEAQL